MPRRTFAALIAALGLCVTLGACGSGSDAGRENYGFKASNDSGVPFELTVSTGGLDPAKGTISLKDAKGRTTAPLKTATNCASENNGDEVCRLTFKAKSTNSAASGELKVKVTLGVEDKDENLLSEADNDSIAIAWLTREGAECEKTSDNSFADVTLDKANGYQAQGLLVLPGGSEHYKNDRLVVVTDADEIFGVTGHVLPYKKVGVRADLVPLG